MKRNRLLWILLVALGLFYIGIGLSRISFNIDILRLLPTHLRQVEGLSLFLKNFALPDELIVTLEAPDAETAKSTAEALAKALRTHPDLVKNAVAEAPWESNPAGLSEFLTFLLLNQPSEKILEIKERLSPAHAESTAENTLEELNTTVSPQQIAILGYDPYRIFSSLAPELLHQQHPDFGVLLLGWKIPSALYPVAQAVCQLQPNRRMAQIDSENLHCGKP